MKRQPPIVVRRVTGDSMRPTYLPGQLVVAWVWWRTLRPGDVVIVRHQTLEKIKRIERIIGRSLWLQGDNSQASTDSRQFGALPSTAVVGKVVFAIGKRRTSGW